MAKRGGFFHGKTSVTHYHTHYEGGISYSSIAHHRDREEGDPAFKPPHEPGEGDWEEKANGTWVWTRRDS